VDYEKMTDKQLEETLDELEADANRNPPELRNQYIREIRAEMQKRTRRKHQKKEEILY